jgi:ubiquinone/menaquinone biosynthesis C-methylase UbiE
MSDERSALIDRLYAHAIRKSPRMRRFLPRVIYQFFAQRYRAREWTFMNYGYVPLGQADEPDRSSIALYNHVAEAVPLAGKDVLEVGCGRGGGSSFIMRYFQPSSLTGVDFSEKAIQFCRQAHQVAGLSFAWGDAERLPFRNGSFDTVVNVESSHCYGSLEAFLAEARRVLRYGGSFLFADFRPSEQMTKLRDALLASGMALVRETDITANIFASLESGEGRRLHLMKAGARGIMRKYFHELVGDPGSMVYEQFRTRELRYLLNLA